MCWSMGASAAMVAAGAGATALTLRRGDAPAIPATFAYFTVMEALQAAGYGVVDQCGSGANQAITVLSYLHITFQPFFINAFALTLLGGVSPAKRILVWLACCLSATTMLLQLYPFDWAEPCTPGTSLCGATLCLVSGEWHIAWDIPFNQLLPALPILPGTVWTFPTYMVAVFIVPLIYGGWRFVLFHALAGPVLASVLTANPNEVPAIWCLFSVGLVALGLIPWLRGKVVPPRIAAAPA